MRLLDRIFSQGVFTYKPDFDPAAWMEELRPAQLVVIDNVAAYYFDDIKSRLDGLPPVQASDFPNVTLPFESTFLEMRIRRGDVIGSTFEECGVLFEMFQPGEIRFGEVKDVAGLQSQEEIRNIVFHPDVAGHLSCSFFVYGRNIDRNRALYVAHFLLPVTAEGKVFAPKGGLGLLGNVYAPDNGDQQKMMAYFESIYLAPCLLAISFMHCKNVTMTTVSPPEKLSKKFEKRSGRPLLRYHIVHIDHAKQMLEREGHVHAEGLKRALHICRGHFAEYGKDGKGLLFGKHAGTFWIPMHTRGNAQEGIILKHYDVK